MPTYTFACPACGYRDEVVMSISQYVRARPDLAHCGQPMERYFEVVPALALHYALSNDRSYEGLRATDGADISSRSKHRAYMKARDLTTVDDFKETWKKQAVEREARMQGKDETRAADIAAAITKLGG